MIDSKNAYITAKNNENLEITFKLNAMDYNSFLLFEHTLKNDQARIRISKPVKPRTTGDYSQNHHINGHVQQICIETGNTFDSVKMAVKLRAVEMGYPFRTISREVVPYSETEASTEDAAILIEAAHIIAAELQIILKEE